MSASNPVPRLYRTVVDEVVKNVREAFLNEGVDEQVLSELKQLWESKLLQSRAIDFMPTDASIRMNLTYPHALHVPGKAGEQNAAQKVSVAGQLVGTDPGTGQMVYVSHHPTLANVGQLSAPAAQAALAIQGTTRHDLGSSSASGSRAQHIQISRAPQQSQQSAQIQQQQQQQLYQQHIQQLQKQHQQQQQIQQQKIQQQQKNISVKNIQQQQQQGQQQQQQLQQQQHQQQQQTQVQHQQQHQTQAQHQQQQQQQQQQHQTQAQQQQQHQTQAQQLQTQAQQQQHLQQTAGIQVLQVQPSTTIFAGFNQPGGARGGPRVIYTQPMQQTPQQRVAATKIIQVDGGQDSSSDDEDDNFDDLDQYPINVDSANIEGTDGDELDDGEEGDSLNSADDISEEDPSDLFDTDNVVVCQYDKIARSKNKWKFYLKDGIMNLKSKDFVFHKANGESEW